MRIAFCHSSRPEEAPSYVRDDAAIFAKMGEVNWERVIPGWRRGIGPTGWLPSPALIARVRRCSLAVQWFATPSAVAVAAAVTRVPVLVVSGGYDVASEPSIGYGRMIGRRTRAMSQLTLRLATRVLSISQFNRSEILRWAPNARTAIVPLGFNADSYPLLAGTRSGVITVGAVSRDYFRRKGLDAFARTSRLLPGVSFTLIGRHVDADVVQELREMGGANLTLTGALSDVALRAALQSARVYAQLSLHEGFGCAVAEAMLSGCSPVVSDRGALPEVVADHGRIVPAGDTEAAARAIRDLLTQPGPDLAARDSIATRFPQSRRENQLRRHVDDVLGRGPMGGDGPRFG